MSQGMRLTIIRCTLMALLIAGRGQTRTIMVGPDPPSELTTLQAALDAALPGDTILVADGIYTGPGNRDIDFWGKAITVRSANGPENCRIDCQTQERGFLFHRDEDARSVLDGFTITYGKVDRGGVISSTERSRPTISNCFFYDNEADRGRGGVSTWVERETDAPVWHEVGREHPQNRKGEYHVGSYGQTSWHTH